jgi:hypothetical protein
MSILFIHGVNVRDSTPEYAKGVGFRRRLFTQIVCPVAVERGFDRFRIEPEVYWGGLGAQFAWNLGSVPRSSIESLGSRDQFLQEHHSLLILLTEISSARMAGSLDLGLHAPGQKGGLLALAARQEPSRFIRAVAAAQLEHLAQIIPSQHTAHTSLQGKQAEDEIEGEQLAILILAADDVAHDTHALAALRGTASDDEALQIVADQVQARFRELAQAFALHDPNTEALGINSIEWVNRYLRDTRRAAKRVVERAQESAARAPSLLLLSGFRQKLTRPALHFFGDVFAYLHRGRSTEGDSISVRVANAVRNAARSCHHTGPLVVVSHSFGSMILYDLLTSGKLDDVEIDLWVSAGAQVSLFAEMRLFSFSPVDIPSEERPHLGKPRGVRRWVNVYDAADTLSYLMEPVFGSDAVADIEFSEGAHLLNAHGAYFSEPSFYRLIARELRQIV